MEAVRSRYSISLIFVGRAEALLILASATFLSFASSTARADAFSDYALTGTFTLPSAISVFDTLPDGRIIAVDVDHVFVESAVGSRVFTLLGVLPGADVGPFGAAFVRVSPNGTKIAVGNNGGASFSSYHVGVFAFPALTGSWYTASHFDAEWFDNRHLAVSSGGISVTMLDTQSANPMTPMNPVVIDDIGGASAGVTVDGQGRLLTGDGFSATETGLVKAFSTTDWMPALSGGSPADFQLDGVDIVDVLSGASLGLDLEGNLHVGGGDFAGGGDVNFVALARASAVQAAMTGGGPVNVSDPAELRMLDPDTVSTSNFYSVTANRATGELYLQSFGDSTVHVYFAPAAIPAMSTWGLIAAGIAVSIAGVAAQRRQRAPATRVQVNQPSINKSIAANSAVHSVSANGTEVRIIVSLTLIALLLHSSSAFAGSPFAASVVDYQPAPGQFVNHDSFSDPAQVVGPPSGTGTIDGTDSGVVTLGGFGGFVVLQFDHTVLDDPANAFGIDAIVFGNAFWVDGDPNRRWAECAHIEISLDENLNGEPDDAWYLVPGSHLPSPDAAFQSQTWDDNTSSNVYPPVNPSWIPPSSNGTWTTSGYRLPPIPFESPVVQNPNGVGAITEGVFGYADLSPTAILGDLDGDNLVDATISPDEFYTVPDDPWEVGLTFGSGGGDGFDIAWAVDSATGQPANMIGFDFIRITSSVNHVHPLFGEKSTEIDAVSDVAPVLFGDIDGDGLVSLIDLAQLIECLHGVEIHPADRWCLLLDADLDSDVDLLDASLVQNHFAGS